MQFKNTREQGKQFEELACVYLTQQGLTLIEKNFYCPFGEIDLIMQDNSCWVFVEVRQRTYNDFGGAIHSISNTKQESWIKSAEYWLNQRNSGLDYCACRFDLVTFEDIQREPNWLINYIEFNH